MAILQALKALANAARANDDGGIGACIAECILGCLAAILEYFNKWAFIYVGVYGYGYMDAGKNVFTLFRDRGWEAVIADVSSIIRRWNKFHAVSTTGCLHNLSLLPRLTGLVSYFLNIGFFVSF